MKIIIKVESETETTKITFSNDEFNNYNYVDMITENESYTVSVDDLEAVAKAFKTEQINMRTLR